MNTALDPSELYVLLKERWIRIEQAGLTQHTEILQRFQGCYDPDPKRRFASLAALDQALNHEIHVKGARAVRPQSWPDVPAAKALTLGYEVGTNRPIQIDRDLLTRHMVVLGSSGSGKSFYMTWLVSQLISKGIQVEFADHKGFGRKLLCLK